MAWLASVSQSIQVAGESARLLHLKRVVVINVDWSSLFSLKHALLEKGDSVVHGDPSVLQLAVERQHAWHLNHLVLGDWVRGWTLNLKWLKFHLIHVVLDFRHDSVLIDEPLLIRVANDESRVLGISVLIGEPDVLSNGLVIFGLELMNDLFVTDQRKSANGTRLSVVTLSLREQPELVKTLKLCHLNASVSWIALKGRIPVLWRGTISGKEAFISSVSRSEFGNELVKTLANLISCTIVQESHLCCLLVDVVIEQHAEGTTRDWSKGLLLWDIPLSS